jgi:hypothetical protein
MLADEVMEGAELLRLRDQLKAGLVSIRDNVAGSGKVQIDIGQTEIAEYDCKGRASPRTGRRLINAMLSDVNARLDVLGIVFE